MQVYAVMHSNWRHACKHKALDRVQAKLTAGYSLQANSATYDMQANMRQVYIRHGSLPTPKRQKFTAILFI